MYSVFKRQRGVTLIEVLVTVVVLAFGLLGLAGMQTNGLKSNMSAYQRSQATYLAADVIDRMRANRVAALAGGYDISLTAGQPTSVGTQAQRDINEWRSRVALALPAGTGSVDCTTANPICQVQIQWADRRGSAAAASSQQIFITSTEL